MNNIELLIERANQASIWRSIPASEKVIAECENKLGIQFPTEYRKFLECFGALAVGDITVSGIFDNSLNDIGGGSVVGDTLRFRKEWQLPINLIIIQPDEDAPYCLKIDMPMHNNEAPVVCFELYNKHTTVIASSFSEWVGKFVFG